MRRIFRTVCALDNLVMDIEPRSLTDEERAVLDLLLSPAVVGVDPLRQQAEDVAVTGCCSCGCPTIDLTPRRESPRAPGEAGVWPVAGRVDPVGDEPPQEVLLFVDDGRLSSLELVYYSESVPSAWPDLSKIRLWRN